MQSNIQPNYDAAAQEILEHREAHYEWMLTHEHMITHAVTLTMDPKKIDAFTRQFSRSMTRNDPEMISRYQDNMRLFVNILERSLFGNMGKRFGSQLFFVSVIEGLNKGEIPHFHCSVGVPESRFAVFDAKVTDAWKRVPFSGFSVKVVPYRDAGWLAYSTKGSMFINRESIDWMNVRIPRNPNPVATSS